MGKKRVQKKDRKNVKKDSKSFYAYTRSKSTVKNSVGPLMGDNGSLAGTDKRDGRSTECFFASVFTKENRSFPGSEATVSRRGKW